MFGAYPDFPATQRWTWPACAAFRKESRMKFADATKFDRKSGVAFDLEGVCGSTQPQD